MAYNLWIGRKIQIWEKGKKYKKLIGIGYYKGSDRIIVNEKNVISKWVKVFAITEGEFKRSFINELECEWNPLTIGDKEMTGLL